MATDDIQYENYACANDKTGGRFVGIKGQAPVWAVDIKDGDGKPKNHLGFDTHPTDEYLHWSLKHEYAIELMHKMRAAYDTLAAAGLLAEVKIIAEAASLYDGCVEAERNNPGW